MRTAEQILKDNDLDLDKWLDTKITIKQAINDARKEAIEECAKRVEMDFEAVGKCEMGHFIDKQSILKLINELK